MKSLVGEMMDTTRKATSWIMGEVPGLSHHQNASATNGSESSPLLSAPRSAPHQSDASGVSPDSKLSFSQQFRPFERSRTALIICLVHVLVYFSIAVGAYGYGFEKWGFIDAIYFAVVIFTTIGYGDLSPTSDASRLFTIFFALYGIGILGAFLSIVGSSLLEASHKAMAKTEDKAKKRIFAMFSTSGDTSDEEAEIKSFCRELCLATIVELPIIAVLLTLSCLLGMPADRSIIESFYFAVVSATTIGFGDFYPSSTVTRAVCIFYLPFCVGVFGQVLSKIAGFYMDWKARQADKNFLKRSLALRDLKAMDVNGDGKVSYGEFLSFILVALEKIDQGEVDEVKILFNTLDVNGTGFLEKEDLVKLANSGDPAMPQTDSIKRMAVNEVAVA